MRTPPPRWVSPQRISKTSRFQDVGESLGAPAGARWVIDGRTNESMGYPPLVKGGRAQGPPLQRSRLRRIRTRKGARGHAEIVFPQPAGIPSYIATLRWSRGWIAHAAKRLAAVISAEGSTDPRVGRLQGEPAPCENSLHSVRTGGEGGGTRSPILTSRAIPLGE